MAVKPPWFPLYVRDLLSDSNCMRMSDEQIGIYFRMMLCYWNERCSLPSDLAQLAAILPRTTPRRLKEAWPNLSRCWTVSQDGQTLHNARLDEEWASMVARSEAAKQKAQKRWDGAPHGDTPEHAGANAAALPGAVPEQCYTQAQAQADKVEPSGSTPRQMPFVSPDEVRAREILALLWPMIQPAVGRSMTQTAWKAKNKATALDFARVGRSNSDLTGAHESASRRMGSTVYSLTIVRDELVRLDNPHRPAATNGKPSIVHGYLNGEKFSCERGKEPVGFSDKPIDPEAEF